MTGTSGAVAARQVLNSPADVYTALWSQVTFRIASAIGVSEFNYTNFETVATVIEDNSGILVVNKKVGKYKNIQDFVNYGKANPMAILDGTEIGSDAHLQSLLLEDVLGIKCTRVDVGGTATKIPALLNGDVDYTTGVYGTFKPYIDSGDFAVLAVFGPERLPGLPDVPTMKEITGKDFGFTKFFGYWLPPGTGKAIVDKFADAVKKAVASEAFKTHCAKYYITPVARTGADVKTYLDDRYAVINKYKDNLIVK
jgi:tripartite-type tricarboxylate transporter receptor subunit TctC